MIISHAIRPFRFGGIAIDQSLWMDGKPWFTAAAIRGFIGLKRTNAVQQIVVRNPHIKEFTREIEILQERSHGDHMPQIEAYGRGENRDHAPQSEGCTRQKNVQKYTLTIFDPIGLQLVIFESRTPKARAYKVAVAHLVWAFMSGRLRERTANETAVERMMGDYEKIKDHGERELLLARIMVEAKVSRSTVYRWIAIYRAKKSPYDKYLNPQPRRLSVSGPIELEIRRRFFKNPTIGAKELWRKVGSPKSPSYWAVKRFCRKLQDEYYAGFFPQLSAGIPQPPAGDSLD